ncbi:hypothetical protein Tsubulata_019519 [Turnera subulata]|uniref:RING-type E3 ubiquitin transferase n=1 Tax=Turnera subulata TaxID=218843 RepID=A0A9Q0JE95_9ROSI|nr:hypothetical protein Tsubulata_019519 [Turnera subulata]
MGSLFPPPPPPSPPNYNPMFDPSIVNFGSSSGVGGFQDNQSISNHRSSNYDINNKIMFTAILSLSLVVVLVIALHIYARCALRRHQARRRAMLSSLGISSAANVHSIEPPKTGLDPAIIASLPLFSYKQNEGETAMECSVCLSMLEDQEMARVLPNCKHTFHAECIDKWLGSRSTCPICRTEAEPLVLQPEPREGPAGTVEGASSDVAAASQPSAKVTGSTSRLSSFRRILSRERSSRRLQPEVQEQSFEDLERQ